jgi:hypothetical protein
MRCCRTSLLRISNQFGTLETQNHQCHTDILTLAWPNPALSQTAYGAEIAAISVIACCALAAAKRQSVGLIVAFFRGDRGRGRRAGSVAMLEQFFATAFAN